MNANLKNISQDLTAFLTKKFKTYFECEYNYIEYPEDLEDLELAVCDEELLEETFDEVMSILEDNEDSYDFETCNKEELEEDIYVLIDDVFYKVRDEQVDIYREKFEMEDMVTEMGEWDEWGN